MSAVVKPGYVRPLDLRQGRIDMAHGSGGRAMAQLVEEIFLKAFDNEWLRALNDAAALSVPAGRVVMEALEAALGVADSSGEHHAGEQVEDPSAHLP